MLTGMQEIGGKKYYFEKDGKSKKGWFELSGSKYYGKADGSLCDGLVYIGSIQYEFDSDGKLIENNTPISGISKTTINQMVKYYQKSGKKYPTSTYNTRGAANIEEFCEIYYEEAKAEGIRAEVAFCQAMKETGWLQFGGDVKANQCNFAGLGATGGVSGASFKDVRTGIRAQIQHLKAYSNKDKLFNACVDPRFNYVKRGSAPYVEWLGAKANPNGVGWATASDYGTSIVSMMNKLLSL